MDAESNDYRITEKELPFAEEVDEDTTVDRLNDFYYTYESLPADLKEDYGELMCHFTSLEELHQHRHDIIHYSWCKNMADVAKHLLDNDPAFAEINERLQTFTGCITPIFTRRLQNRRNVKCRIMSNKVDRGRNLRPQSIAIREAGWLFCILSERR